MSISTVECCDCMDFMAEFPDKYFDLAIVDPPYGINVSLGGCGSRTKKYNRSKSKNWDSNAPSEHYWSELFRTSQHQIIWGMNYFSLPPCKGFIVWDKRQPDGVTFAQAEIAYCSVAQTSKIFRLSPIGQSNRIHQAQKPVALYVWLLENYAKPGDKILDTHMGSQSSRIAAWKMGFDYWGCEIDQEYFNQGCARFEKERRQLSLFAQPEEPE